MKIKSKPHTITDVLLYDPELRFTPGGHAVCRLYVGDAGDGECKEHWVIWREDAERAAEILQRNMMVKLTGYGQSREWVDFKTGEKTSRMEYTTTEPFARLAP